MVNYGIGACHVCFWHVFSLIQDFDTVALIPALKCEELFFCYQISLLVQLELKHSMQGSNFRHARFEIIIIIIGYIMYLLLVVFKAFAIIGASPTRSWLESNEKPQQLPHRIRTYKMRHKMENVRQEGY